VSIGLPALSIALTARVLALFASVFISSAADLSKYRSAVLEELNGSLVLFCSASSLERAEVPTPAAFSVDLP